MSIVDHKALPVPYAVELPDRVRKERYYDPEFYAMEVELLWPRVWQLACRLEEIPAVGDFAEYSNLDHSVVVVRTDDGVRAFHNSCRHRGVKIAEGRGTLTSGFTCPFHGWCYGLDGANTYVPQRRTFAEHNLQAADIDLVPVQCEVWGACVWINLDPGAPPLRDCIDPFATVCDAWRTDSLRAEWLVACHLPVNWKLAQEAFVEQYHVFEAHPQLLIAGRFPRKGQAFDPRTFIDAELQYLQAMCEGMDGMVHRTDFAIAERLRDIELPADPELAIATWHRTYNDAVTAWHRDAGHDMPDLNELEATGMNEPMGYCFPHHVMLPMYSSSSAYRFRPLGPEDTMMEIWSLTRYAPGEEPAAPPIPEMWACDDPRLPPIPAQDFSNLPRQQKGLHSRGFEYMRLSQGVEGHIANYHRLIDGYLAGLSYDQLVPALRRVNVNPLDHPVVDIGF